MANAQKNKRAICQCKFPIEFSVFKVISLSATFCDIKLLHFFIGSPIYVEVSYSVLCM